MNKSAAGSAACLIVLAACSLPRLGRSEFETIPSRRPNLAKGGMEPIRLSPAISNEFKPPDRGGGVRVRPGEIGLDERPRGTVSEGKHVPHGRPPLHARGSSLRTVHPRPGQRDRRRNGWLR